MDIRELRIGNWVYSPEEENVIIESINSTWCNIRTIGDGKFHESYACPVMHVMPIPLTPEILERCGFQKSNNHSLDYFLKCNNSNLFSFRLSRPFRHNNQWYPVKAYVHQLQNLVLDLTGEELVIK